MKSKLTLSIDKSVLEKAESFADSRNVCLSEIVENYLIRLIMESLNDHKVSFLVESLTGIIPDSYDEKKDYREYITSKI